MTESCAGFPATKETKTLFLDVFSTGLVLVHGIADVPLFSQAVHQLHDVQGFVQRHLRRLTQAFGDGVPAGEELVFVARNLLRDMDFLPEHPIGTVHRDALGVIDIVDDDVPLRPRNDTVYLS